MIYGFSVGKGYMERVYVFLSLLGARRPVIPAKLSRSVWIVNVRTTEERFLKGIEFEGQDEDRYVLVM